MENILKFSTAANFFQKLIRNIEIFKNGAPLKFKHVTTSRNFSTNFLEDKNLWVRSPNPDVPTIVGRTIPELIWEQVLKFEGSAPSFECGVTGRKYTFSQLYDLSQGLGAGLMRMGLQRVDVVALILPNIPEFPIALLGSLEAGLVVSTINPGYTAHEIGVQLLSSNARCVVTLSEFLPTIMKVLPSCPNLKKIILIHLDQSVVSEIPQNCVSFFDLVKTDPRPMRSDFLKGSEVDTTQFTALLPYSSGTTGPPKGVELTHKNITTNVWQHIQPDTGTARSFLDGDQDRFFGFLPFYHSYGLHMFCFYGIFQGAHTLCLPKFDPVTFVKALRYHRPTILHLAPPLISFMCQSKEAGPRELESVRSILASAAPVGEALSNSILEKAGKFIFLQEGWGMTELSPTAMLMNSTKNNSKIGSCGTLIPSTIGKVIHLKTGQNLASNQRGELCIKGPQMMKGYLNNEKATKEAIDEEGWLHTGDVCYYDDDKCFYIVDRLKELIKVKGYQVAPAELEDILRDLKDVIDVAVIGVPDEASGQLPRAYIVRHGNRLTSERVNEFMKDKVIHYKQLKGGIEFVKSIPKSSTGKILRRKLFEEYKAKFLDK